MNKLYVGNIPHRANEEQLKALFTDFGQVSEVKVIMDRETGRSRGFGFVTMENQLGVDSILQHVKQTPIVMDGRQLRINIAQDRDTRSSGGAGRGGNAGRRSGGSNW